MAREISRKTVAMEYLEDLVVPAFLPNRGQPCALPGQRFDLLPAHKGLLVD